MCVCVWGCSLCRPCMGAWCLCWLHVVVLLVMRLKQDSGEGMETGNICGPYEIVASTAGLLPGTCKPGVQRCLGQDVAAMQGDRGSSETADMWCRNQSCRYGCWAE